MRNVITIILAVIVTVFVWREFQSPSPQETAVTEEKKETSGVKLESKEISREVADNGIESVVFQNAQPIIKLIEVQVEDRRKIDSVLKANSVLQKEVTSVSRYAGTMEAKALKLQQKVDEITRDTSYIYKDPFLDIAFYRDPISREPLSDIHYNFDFSDLSYDRTSWRLNRDFGKRFNYTVVTPTDARATIRTLEKLTIKRPPDNYSVKLQAQAEYSSFTKSAGFGSNLSLRYKRLNLDGAYLFFPEENAWYPEFRMSFDLVEL